MTWPQVYDPVHSPALSTCLAATPVVALLGGIGLFRMRAHVAALLGLAVALTVALCVYRMPAAAAAGAALSGAVYGLFPIGWIVLNLLFLYQMTVERGWFSVMRSSLARVAPDPRVQVILIAFSFGSFFEGAAGFGTPVAITAAILMQLGFRPLAASGLSLIANTAPVAFGALGTPLIALAGVTGLDLHSLSAMVGRDLSIFSVIVPFWVVMAMAGWRATMEVWPAALVAGVSFGIVQFLVAEYHGPWLVDIAASVASMGSLILLLRFWRPKSLWKLEPAAPAEARTGAASAAEAEAAAEFATGEPGAAAARTPASSPAEVRRAWIPWYLLSALVFAWGLPRVKAWLDSFSKVSFSIAGLDGVVQRMPPVVAHPTPEPAAVVLSLLSATGSGILVAAILSGLVMGFSPLAMVRAYAKTLHRVRHSLLTIAAMLGLGYVTRYAGLDATMGLALAKTGGLYPFFGTMLGWLGVALTGSDTSSNVLFGSLQRITSQRLGLNPVMMASANSAGGVMGKMIDAQSIVVASTATYWYGHEGSILRFVFFHSLALAALMGLLVYAEASFPAFASMVVHWLGPPFQGGLAERVGLGSFRRTTDVIGNFTPSGPSRPKDGRLAGLLAAFLVLAAIAAAWANSFFGPFILDDAPAISENPTIRHLWPPGAALSPPPDGETVTGRPLLNLSFAVNWAISGPEVWSYHLANLALHAAAALALLGLARRTLLLPRLRRRFGEAALPLATAAALVWAVHPLTTESVTYVAQRAESMAGLFYLLTLYGFVRSAGEGERLPRFWRAFAVGACLCGLGTKETVVSAPLIVLLYDRTLVAGSFRGALRAHPWFYAALAATWLPFAGLVAATGSRGATAGFGLGVTPWTYALTQCRAIAHYLRLAIWPRPLILDYGFALDRSPLAVLPQAVLVLALLGASAAAVWRNRPAGVAAAWFFALLAPSSSFVPVVTQTIAEHRMYLPLAAMVVLAVCAVHAWLGRRALVGWLVLAVALAAATARRNADYADDVAMWRDVIAKRPGNTRAYEGLGAALSRRGRTAEAIRAFETSLQLNPGNLKAHYNLAGALLNAGRPQEAFRHYAAAEGMGNGALAAYGLGNADVRMGRLLEAEGEFERAVRLNPESYAARNNLGNVLEQLGRRADAVPQFEAAIRLAPSEADPRFNLANALVRLGRPAEAVPQYEALLRLAPRHADGRINYGIALIATGRRAEGIRQLRIALRLDPGNAIARAELEAAQRAPP